MQYVARWFCGLLATATLCACPKDEARDPSAAGQRDTEIRHEACDLRSSSAVALDASGDGRPDLVKVMDGNRESCRAADINFDTMIDVFVYFDDQGRVRRRESGFDRDNRPDEIAYYQAGVLVRKERETNNDAKIDTWDYYHNGRLVREERDSTGDGFVDQWWSFDRPDKPKCALVVSDGDGDGKPDPGSKIDLCAEPFDDFAAPAATAAKGGEAKDEEPPVPEAPSPDQSGGSAGGEPGATDGEAK
jgi:hypothetical protein